jgi:hypothetical protein
MAFHIPSDQRDKFYAMAVLGLKAVDARGGGRQRLDANADATWAAYKGEQLLADRVDLLVRDAAVTQPTAFAPRVVFDLEGIAEDDAFGAEWPGARGQAAGDWLRALPPSDALAFLREVARVWGLAVTAPAESLGQVKPSTRLVVAGAGALLATFEAFDGRSGFAFAEQVTVVADHPGERQLAGLAGALLGSHEAVKLLSPTSTPEAIRAAFGDQLVVSPDVSASVQRALDMWRQQGLVQ